MCPQSEAIRTEARPLDQDVGPREHLVKSFIFLPEGMLIYANVIYQMHPCHMDTQRKKLNFSWVHGQSGECSTLLGRACSGRLATRILLVRRCQRQEGQRLPGMGHLRDLGQWSSSKDNVQCASQGHLAISEDILGCHS